MKPLSVNDSDDTVHFLPHRLNRQPVVVRGLTADELWICTGLCAVTGLISGLPLALFTGSLAMVPSMMVLAITLGVFIGGGVLRRHKRGRPETWLYRQLQWWLAQHWPSLHTLLGDERLITRSGYWTVRRGDS
ncbi:TIGR03750 family conjugal transfer protein [Pseudomonas fluorescens]|nr:TIGR03750 family conjugal transfer protein [Pseudomonas fluorescens]